MRAIHCRVLCAYRRSVKRHHRKARRRGASSINLLVLIVGLITVATAVVALIRQEARQASGNVGAMLARVTGSDADEPSPSPADQEPLSRGLGGIPLGPDLRDERSTFDNEWAALANEFNRKSEELADEWSDWQKENPNANAAEYEAAREGFAKRGEALYREREQAQNALLEQHGIPIE